MISRLWMFSILGAFLGILGFVTVLIWPTVLHSIVSGRMAISNKSASYESWKSTTMPLRMEVFLFNWTNPHFTKNGSLLEVPNLEEKGPYVFLEHREKVDIVWNDANSTVTYFQNRTWFFDPIHSNGTLEDKITTLNVPAVTTAFAVRNSPILALIVNGGFKLLGIKIPETRTVAEFVFDGYSNPIMDIIELIPEKDRPFVVPFSKFGWFFTRNGSKTYDGSFNMETGAKDINLVGKLAKWNYENRTNYFPSYCGLVNGSAGELFGPGIKQNKPITFYSPDICRPIDLTFAKESVVSGISAYRYVGDPAMFKNKTSVPDNWCYRGADPNEGHPDGVLDISVCKWGSPLFVSFPHFYKGDPTLRSAVRGMSPEQRLHEMTMDIEPLTGVPVSASAGLQINVHIQTNPRITLFANMPDIYFPAIWFKEIASVDGETEEELKGLSNLEKTPSIVGYVILSLGVTILLVIGLICLARKYGEGDESSGRNGDASEYLVSPPTANNTNHSDD